MTKRWITARRLTHEQGMSWADAEQVIREESLRMQQGRFGWLLSLFYIACLAWILGVGRWLFPELHGLARHGIDLAVIAVMVVSMFFVPRLLAHDAILARAREHARGRATQNN